jgi:hypothetical protein
MFTGSADHPRPDESITRVGIVDRVTRSPAPPGTHVGVDSKPGRSSGGVKAGLDWPSLDGDVLVPSDPADDGWMAEAAARDARTCSSGRPVSGPSGGPAESGSPGGLRQLQRRGQRRERARSGRRTASGAASPRRSAAAGFPTIDQSPVGAAGRRRAGRRA